MLIVHKCRTCDHPDYWGYREGRYDQHVRLWPNQGCGQGCHPGVPCDWGESHVIPTYRPDTTVETTIVVPGEAWANTGITACGCEQCQALYASEAVAA
jgi:hypothetical protein